MYSGPHSPGNDVSISAMTVKLRTPSCCDLIRNVFMRDEFGGMQLVEPLSFSFLSNILKPLSGIKLTCTCKQRFYLFDFSSSI